MKKEWVAGLLLAALFGASLLNIRYLDGMMSSLRGAVERSWEYAEAGGFEEAAELVEQAAEEWEAADSYTHIVIRHTEIDSLSDAFYDLLGYLKASDIESAEGGYKKLLYHITSIATMEYVTLKSVF